MLDYEIIEAANKEDLIKQFKSWVEKNQKVNIFGIQAHVVPTLKGVRFYLTFLFAKQSNLMMMGAPGQA